MPFLPAPAKLGKAPGLRLREVPNATHCVVYSGGRRHIVHRLLF